MWLIAFSFIDNVTCDTDIILSIITIIHYIYIFGSTFYETSKYNPI